MIKKRLKSIRNLGTLILKLIDDIFLILGMALLSIGVFKIFIPAGYITLGICFIAFAFFIAEKGR
ncbi:hypothetical protein [Maledivibacter halophilus]|uniref:Uncharacterized protein n=1 Tax=Maledivibacter halophilus TaxID=36842 RepID=A0A1T5KFB3_9FIRM|nr:hypothetical protein [Maledivibacter halophilus]SKC62406.1 hypothetical protein SAMN02194393_01753 [Maledivibacter halophilus]